MNTTDIFDRGIQNFRGTRDYFGDDMRWRQSVIETIRQSFELFGFEPLETPLIENERTLSGKYGEEGEKKRFRLSMPYPQESGLRYDQTVPLARFMAMNWNRFPLPYRRYVIGPVFRDESVQAGRLRQFTQCDFDTVGSSSMVVDAEIVAINYTVLTKLGFKDLYKVQVNDRKLLDTLALKLKITDEEQKKALFRAWDKLEKSDRTSISQELVSAGFDKYTLRRFNVMTDILQKTIGLPSDQVISILLTAFKDEKTKQAVIELEKLALSILDMGVPQDRFTLYPLLARGLDYYTGPIFETVVTASGVGSITGGGRFDNLIEQMGGPNLPASGSSFGLERVMSVMDQFGLKPATTQTTSVLATIFDLNNSQTTSASFRLASQLRLDSINTEIYTGAKLKLGSQLDIARRKNIPIAIIVGPDEISNNTVTVKDMIGKSQVTIPQNLLVETVNKLLNK